MKRQPIYKNSPMLEIKWLDTAKCVLYMKSHVLSLSNMNKISPSHKVVAPMPYFIFRCSRVGVLPARLQKAKQNKTETIENNCWQINSTLNWIVFQHLLKTTFDMHLQSHLHESHESKKMMDSHRHRHTLSHQLTDVGTASGRARNASGVKAMMK